MTSRSLLIKQLPCIACTLSKVKQVSATESHHQNKFGLAGKERLGDHAQVPLCQYHHRNVIPLGQSGKLMRSIFGPSLAGEPKAFRSVFGEDQDLLELTNKQLAAM